MASKQYIVGLLYHSIKSRGWLAMVPEEIALDMRAFYLQNVGCNQVNQFRDSPKKHLRSGRIFCIMNKTLIYPGKIE